MCLDFLEKIRQIPKLVTSEGIKYFQLVLNGGEILAPEAEICKAAKPATSNNELALWPPSKLGPGHTL